MATLIYSLVLKKVLENTKSHLIKRLKLIHVQIQSILLWKIIVCVELIVEVDLHKVSTKMYLNIINIILIIWQNKKLNSLVVKKVILIVKKVNHK